MDSTVNELFQYMTVLSNRGVWWVCWHYEGHSLFQCYSTEHSTQWRSATANKQPLQFPVFSVLKTTSAVSSIFLFLNYFCCFQYIPFFKLLLLFPVYSFLKTTSAVGHWFPLYSFLKTTSAVGCRCLASRLYRMISVMSVWLPMYLLVKFTPRRHFVCGF